MQISCGKCNINNEILEIQELNDIEGFYERFLIIGKCRICDEDLATLVETRVSDDRVFFDSHFGTEASKIIKREKKRIKFKYSNGHNYNGFVYGVNKEIKNKKGEIVRIRQYASDYLTQKHTLIKTILVK